VLDSIKYPLIIHSTLPFFLYICISPFFTKFSPFSTHSNIVVKDILQTHPRWMGEREDMLPILPSRLLTQMQHHHSVDYLEYTCVHPGDIPHTQIHLSPQSNTSSQRTLATQPPLTPSPIYWGLQILNAATYLWHAAISNARPFTHTYYFYRSCKQGHMVAFRFWVHHLASTKGWLVSPGFFPCVRLRCFRLYSMCIWVSQPTVLASIQSDVDWSFYHLVSGMHLVWHTSGHPKSQLQAAIINRITSLWCDLSWALSRNAAKCILLDYVQPLSPFFQLFYCT